MIDGAWTHAGDWRKGECDQPLYFPGGKGRIEDLEMFEFDGKIEEKPLVDLYVLMDLRGEPVVRRWTYRAVQIGGRDFWERSAG